MKKRRKLSYEFVQDFIREKGDILLNKEYKNNQTKLLIRCKNNHEFYMTFGNYQQGHYCPICYGNKKYTINEVEKYVSRFGYMLISKEYKGNHKKLQMLCPNNHIFEITFSHFKNGIRCAYCSGNNKKTYEEVKQFIESLGYTLLSKEYKNNREKLKVKCDRGHIYQVSFSDLKQGCKCGKCAKCKKHTFEYVKKYIENNNYELLSLKYRGNSNKLVVKCPNNHIYSVTFAGFQAGCKCRKCFESKVSIHKKLKKYELINKEKDIYRYKCTYCGKWFTPTKDQLYRRLNSINNRYDDYRLYCSEKCKKECPIFKQQKYFKGYKVSTSREVQADLRQLVFDRDMYICQKCLRSKEELEVGLHCHHVKPINESPIESADLDSCITVCKNCHQEIHSKIGCSYHELKCI